MSNSERTHTRPAPFGLDAGLGPALPLSRRDSEWFIEQVVDRVLDPEKKPRLRLFSLRSVSLAALAVITSTAAATVVHQQFRRNVSPNPPDVSVPQRQTDQRMLGHARPVTASQSSAQSTPDATPSVNTAVLTRGRSPALTNAPDARLPAQQAAVIDELSAANELRRNGEWQAAEVAYRGIAARYPGAPQAVVARLSAAELRLEHLGDAAGALRSYQSVPQGSALGVEALFGASRAYRALGNLAAEAAALRSLVDAYPTSLQADGARKRLQQLSAETTNQ